MKSATMMALAWAAALAGAGTAFGSENLSVPANPVPANENPVPAESPNPVPAERIHDRLMATAWLDNDFRWSDKYYTSHQRISLSEVTAFSKVTSASDSLFVSLGQEMYAPKERFVEHPSKKDHPYCGFLYASAGMSFLSDEFYQSVELQLGVVGSAALAHETQERWHKIIGSDTLDGWDTQVKNQPGLNLMFECGGKIFREGKLREGYAFDWRWRGFFEVGTVRDVLSAGTQIRWGKNLPRDLGYRSMRYTTSHEFLHAGTPDYWYIFADFHVDAVAYDVTLGGGMLRHHHDSDVTPYPFSCELTLGATMLVGNRFLISVGESFRRKDFVTADKLYFAYTGVRLSYVF